ncbi:acyl carrier protein [Pseudoalteromonas sp. C2R02]|uniref:acyl carrier protein n=1 Tax=Pseudoalteromonas sp. C2R02 TaxID=2841565 RepID=UPI001C099C89|nr:acyl carrier protein [Pseudoalteromonas sp. C2R02]MBU2971750.1 acyl carrier protein [Pseudoalteromonas sp. C2R02]
MVELQDIFRDVLENKELVLTNEMSAKDHNKWDSLAHIKLILEVENHFKIRFRNAQIASLNNVGDLVNLIEKKVA